MECRKCGACCIAPSISSSIPGMPDGKPSNVRCIHLTQNNLCELWGKPERPKVCIDCKADEMFCGNSFEEAIKIFLELEK